MDASTVAEKNLVQGVTTGSLVDVSGLPPAERVIRPALYRNLLLAKSNSSGPALEIDPRGIRIKGAIFPDDLDLEALDVSFPIEWQECTFRGPVRLTRTNLRTLAGDRSVFEDDLIAVGVQCRGEFSLRKSVLQGILAIDEANISGSLDLRGATLKGMRGWQDTTEVSYSGDGSSIGADLLMSPANGTNFSAEGLVRLDGATIGGQWNCLGAKFLRKNAKCLSAEGLDVKCGLYMHSTACDVRFEAHGEVRLARAKIGVVWSCIGAAFLHPKTCIYGDGIQVVGDVVMRTVKADCPFEAHGEVHLLGASLGGDWSCGGGKFLRSTDRCIDAAGVTVGGSLNMRANDSGPFVASGVVSLLGAKVTGQWDCEGGHFLGNVPWEDGRSRATQSGVCSSTFTGGDSIRAEAITVEGPVLMSRDFTACGAVRLQHSRMRSALDCSVPHLLDISSTEVSGNVELVLGVCSYGKPAIVASSATFGQGLTIDTRAVDDFCVDLAYAETAEQMSLRISANAAGEFNLTRATAGTWDLKNLLLSNVHFRLQGFKYGSVDPPTSAGEKWMKLLLRRCDGDTYGPQPYRQLYSTLRAQGHLGEAIKVAMDMRRQEMLRALIWSTPFPHKRYPRDVGNGLIRLGHILSWGVTGLPRTLIVLLWWCGQSIIGYGYKIWRVFIVATVVCFLSGYAYFQVTDGHVLDVMAPASPPSDYAQRRVLPPGFPPFNPWVYAADQFLPIIDFGQASAYRPLVETDQTPLPKNNGPADPWKEAGVNAKWGSLLMALNWVLIALGWFLTTLLVAPLASMVRKVDSDQ